MTYDPRREIVPCTVCGRQANGYHQEFQVWQAVDRSFCGDFSVTPLVASREKLPLKDPKQRALASYLIRKMQGSGGRPELPDEFFRSLRTRALPTPAEASDNLIMWMAEQQDGRPGRRVEIAYDSADLLGTFGVIDSQDIGWIVANLKGARLLEHGQQGTDSYAGNLTPGGWARFEELKRAHVASRYAFLARRFANPELDQVVERCLRPAVKQIGFDLRTVTQRAGLIDAVIEDEIRRCRFLIADLSDDNAGAYWEAGFAEGLGKDVIYICRVMEPDGKAEKKTHFDTNHRQTVRWDMASLDQTATQLKAVIRNTLLGDANQTD
jgi:nucleoside 2-deoxyribosyltransferase